MSLKAFHIFFIAVSAALCLWLVGWGWAHRAEAQGAALAGVGAAGFVGLGIYLRHFLRKMAPPSNGFHPKAALAFLVPASSLMAKDAFSCTVCMGQPDANTTHAFFWGIFFLGALVWATVVGIAVMMYKAMKAHDSLSVVAVVPSPAEGGRG